MNPNYIQVLDMTGLFTKEILLYSLFDIKFKKPFRLMFGIYFVILFLIWSLPIIILTFDFINVYLAAFAIGPAILMASLMSQPIWNGKSFSAFAKAQINFLSEPKIYYDCVAGKPLETYIIDHTYTVSRRKDYMLLDDFVKRNNGKK